MAKKKHSDVVYKPIYPPQQTIEATNPVIEIERIPPYEDESVEYKRYAKRKLGDSYQLINQRLFSTWGNNALTIADQNAYTVPEGKSVYITDIIIGCNIASGCVVGIADGQTGAFGSLQSLNVAIAGNSQISINLKTPLEFKKSIIWAMDNGGSQIYINFVGWEEG